MINATADGKSFREIGLGLKKHNIPVLPPTRDYSIEIAGRDGEIDFGSTYGPRVINLECIIMADDTTLDYHRRVAKVAALLMLKKGMLYSPSTIYQEEDTSEDMPVLLILKDSFRRGTDNSNQDGRTSLSGKR